MSHTLPPRELDAIATEILGLLGTGRQVAPPSVRFSGLGPADALAVAARIHAARVARGERPLGRKIGFTNRGIWEEYGVDAPLWSWVWDTTVAGLAEAPELDLTGYAEPKIEPEIVLGLARAPRPGMDPAALAGCLGWVAHGFEIVQSLYPGWRFTGPDATVAMGLHGCLRLGPRLPPERLAAFTIDLVRNGTVEASGSSAAVLGSPLDALAHLVAELGRTDAPPLEAGEMVSTGTLTRALPALPGDTWSTRIAGAPIPGIELTLAAPR